MRVVWYHFRSGASRGVTAYLGIVVILGLVGGGSMAAVAGSRRTATAYDGFLRASAASMISFNAGGYDPAIDEAVRRLPGVVETATYVGFNVVGVDAEGRIVEDQPQNAEALGSVDGRYFRQDRPVLLEGRMPDPARADEALVNEAMLADFGLTIGQRQAFNVYSDDQLESFDPEAPPEPVGHGQVMITGVALFGDEVVQSDAERFGRLLLTPAFTQANLGAAAYGWQGILLEPDQDIGEFREQVRGLLPSDYAPNFRDSEVDRQRARKVTRPLVLALAVFGLLAGLATIVLVGQSVLRSIRSAEGDIAVLRALGAGPGVLAGTAAIGPVLATLAGSGAALAMALILSPLAPVGVLRRVEPAPGFQADWAVMGPGLVIGLALILGIVAVGSVIESRPASSRRRARLPRSTLASLPARLGMSPSVVTGARSAFGGGAQPGQQTLTRSTVLGAVIAVGALSASLGFAGSLQALADNPRLFGWDWDVAFIAEAGYGSMDLDAAADVLDHDSGVTGWAPVWFGGAALNGRNVPLLGIDHANPLTPPLISGRRVASADEVVLGVNTLEDLDVKVDDFVTIGEPARPLKVVGVASFPAMGAYQSTQTSLGVGAMLDASNLPSVQLSTSRGYSGPNALIVRLAAARSPEGDSVLRSRLAESLNDVSETPDSVALVGVQRPAEIVDNQSMGLAPSLLAAVVAGAVLVSLALALTSSVRRRRGELAMLRALGFTGRELGATVSTQASLIAAVGLVLGLPIGIALGRWLWFLFARELAVVPSPTVPLAALAVLTVGVLVLSNVVALAPAAVARRTRAADILKDQA